MTYLSHVHLPADAHTEALARRWTLRDTDEGETYACRPCSTSTTKGPR